MLVEIFYPFIQLIFLSSNKIIPTCFLLSNTVDIISFLTEGNADSNNGLNLVEDDLLNNRKKKPSLIFFSSKQWTMRFPATECDYCLWLTGFRTLDPFLIPTPPSNQLLPTPFLVSPCFLEYPVHELPTAVQRLTMQPNISLQNFPLLHPLATPMYPSLSFPSVSCTTNFLHCYGTHRFTFR